MDADRHGKAVCRSKPAAVLHPSLFHRIARRWKVPACLNAAGVRRMPPGRPGRGKAAQGEEPQEGGARGNAPPNFEHSTTADHGKQGTKSRKKHGLLLIRGSGPPLSLQAGKGPGASPCGRLRTFLRPCASVHRLQGGRRREGPGDEALSGQRRPRLARRRWVKCRWPRRQRGKARKPAAAQRDMAPAGSRRFPQESARVRLSPLKPPGARSPERPPPFPCPPPKTAPRAVRRTLPLAGGYVPSRGAQGLGTS